MPSDFPRSPKLLKGALVAYESQFLGPVPNVIVFQYNPDQLRPSKTERLARANTKTAAKLPHEGEKMTTSTKEALWLGCKEKACCSFYTVFPTGLDIWRIATTLRVSPWAFTTPVRAEEGAPVGLILDRSAQHFRVALAKAPAKDKKLSPYVFSMHFPDGTARCGLGKLRPSPCHSFPSLLIGNALYLINDGGCSCRKWSLSEADIEEETTIVKAEGHAREAYYKLVANWNEYIGQATSDESFSYHGFCRYLLEIYTTFGNRPKELARDERN